MTIGRRLIVSTVLGNTVRERPLNDMPAKVWLVELVGSEKLVDLSCGDDVKLMAEVKAEEDIAVEQTVGVRLNPERLHLFDPETGRSLRD